MADRVGLRSAIHFDLQGLSESCSQILQDLGQLSQQHGVNVNTSALAIQSTSEQMDNLTNSGGVPFDTTDSAVTKYDRTTEASCSSIPLETSNLDSIYPEGSPGVFGIKTTPSLTSKTCSSACNCQCHTQNHIRSPSWLRRVVGDFFISYSGIRYTLGRKCDRKSCYRNNRSSLYVSYVFPTVQIAKMFSFKTAWNDPIGIRMTLHVPAVIELGSRTWDIIATNNPVLLRMAFDRREAHPTDVSPSGRSLLHVRYVFQLPACVNVFWELTV